MIIDYVIIGERIRYFRVTKNMSQEELAEQTELSRVLISCIERGERIPSLETVIKITNVLEVNINDILAENLTVSNSAYDSDFFDLLLDCSKNENDILIKAITALKNILRSYSISK